MRREFHMKDSQVGDFREARAAEILTASEVAQELRCSKAQVHNLITGKVHGIAPLPAIALGRRRLVRRSSLYEWLRANERTSE